MIDIIKIDETIDYEFELDDIGLIDHVLIIDSDEGNFIRYNDSIFYIDSNFLESDNLSLPEESELFPPIFLTLEQKELIKEIFYKIINLN